jgi:hypothetical protein
MGLMGHSNGICELHHLMLSSCCSWALQVIGHGATISAPHMHAHCLDILEPHLVPGDCWLAGGGPSSCYLTSCMFLLQPGYWRWGLPAHSMGISRVALLLLALTPAVHAARCALRRRCRGARAGCRLGQRLPDCGHGAHGVHRGRAGQVGGAAPAAAAASRLTTPGPTPLPQASQPAQALSSSAPGSHLNPCPQFGADMIT